jgi:hypothetical protein
MYDGKKSKSFDIFYERHRHRCREERRGRSGDLPQSHYVNVTPRWRCAAAVSAVPTSRSHSRCVRSRKKSLAMKWLIGYSRNRNERSMAKSSRTRSWPLPRKKAGVQEEGGDPQDGRGQQGIQPLPFLITTVERATWPRGTSHSRATSASWRTSMPGRRPLPSASCTTRVLSTRSVRYTTVRPPWTGWPGAGAWYHHHQRRHHHQLEIPWQQVQDQPDRYAGSRGLHRGGGA